MILSPVCVCGGGGKSPLWMELHAADDGAHLSPFDEANAVINLYLFNIFIHRTIISCNSILIKVPLEGFEPPTLRVETVCSLH